MSATIRFSGAPGLARFITLDAQTVSVDTAYHVVQTTVLDPGSPAHARALDQFTAEAFPGLTWRERLVKPRQRLEALSEDLLLHTVRKLCPDARSMYGR